MYNFLLFLVVYLPFQVALNPSEGVDLASIRALIIAAFLLWLAQSLKNKKVVVKNTLQTWLVAMFLFLNALSLVVAKNTDWSLRKLGFLFSIFPVYFVVAEVINTREKMIKIIKAAVLGGSAVALIGIGQFLMQFTLGLEKTYKLWAESVIGIFLGTSFSAAVLANPSWLVNIAGKTYLRATAIFPDPHMLAFYLGLLIPTALGLLMSERRKKIIWAGCLIALLIADLLTFSRGGYLGLFAGAVCTFVVLWKRIGKKYKIIAVTAGALVVLGLSISSPVSQRFFSSFNLKEGSNQGRIATWKKALEVIKDNPAIGVGIGNYPLAIKAIANYREPIYAHNTYLDVAAETGIPNALVWLSLLGIVATSFYVKSRKNSLELMMAVGVIIFATHSLVETAIYSPVVLTLLVIFIALSNINLDDEKKV